jgi:hypothetical protein
VIVSGYLLWSRHIGPGPFDEEGFEEIVQRVRATKMDPDTVRYFRVNDDLDPDSFEEIPADVHTPRGGGRGTINAWMTEDSKLMMLLRTRDHGHAGEKGFLYWEGEELRNYERAASDWEISEKAAPHWWSVYFDLG